MLRTSLLIATVLLLGRPTFAAPPCAGDCDGAGGVTVDEIVRGVGIALGSTPPGQCTAVDGNRDGEVTVDEIVTAVNNALNGCPDFLGNYAGTVTLSGGRTATMEMSTAANGTASAVVEVYDGAAGIVTARAAVPRHAGNPLYSFNISGTVNLDSGDYSLSGSVNEPGRGTVPVQASGRLPLQPGASGSFTFHFDSTPFVGSIVQSDGSAPTPTRSAPAATSTPTPTPTPGQATSPTIPTPAPGCGGGYTDLRFSSVSGDVNANQPLTHLELTKGAVNLSFIAAANLGGFGGSFVRCPVPVNGVTGGVSWAVQKFGGRVTAGESFPLSSAFGASNVGYSEGTGVGAGVSLKIWKSVSGTLTIDSIAGGRATFHVSNARMQPSTGIGAPALGSFTLDFSATVDVTILEN